jgi:hypothetical protein
MVGLAWELVRSAIAHASYVPRPPENKRQCSGSRQACGTAPARGDRFRDWPAQEPAWTGMPGHDVKPISRPDLATGIIGVFRY